QPRGARPCPVLVERCLRRRGKPRIAGEREVVVGREIRDRSLVEHHARALRPVDDASAATAMCSLEPVQLRARVVVEAHRGGLYPHYLPMQNRANTSSSTRSPTSTPRSCASAATPCPTSSATISPGRRAACASAAAPNRSRAPEAIACCRAVVTT